MVQQSEGKALYSTDKRDFGPRVGFAWDVTGKGTTVIRAGTGISYDTVPMDALVTFQGASLPSIPTGFTLYNADGTTRPSPGNIQSGVPVLGPNQLNWVYNAPGAPVVPVFNSGAERAAVRQRDRHQSGAMLTLGQESERASQLHDYVDRGGSARLHEQPLLEPRLTSAIMPRGCRSM